MVSLTFFCKSFFCSDCENLVYIVKPVKYLINQLSSSNSSILAILYILLKKLKSTLSVVKFIESNLQINSRLLPSNN